MIQLRKPTEQDIERFKECLAADEYHKDQDPDVWIKEPGELMTFFDKHNNRVWVRIEKVLRVHVQHDPATPDSKQVFLFHKAFAWLQGMARISGFSEVLFKSTAQPLIAFFMKRFGFAATKDEYSVHLDVPCADPRASKSN